MSLIGLVFLNSVHLLSLEVEPIIPFSMKMHAVQTWLKAYLFTVVSSKVLDLFDHCKLYTVMTINFVLYVEA